ncbi:uncharacterized protein F4812DRAFT_455899 [Daldinia caldariorum]|uniref:uncharacterized protein n=1 Tax=Daldinia caldariorum TaxID=326644 RepID=UPI00200809B8|nr:uncharacterized protein F4812DRAFT_455899 [Daldinia caldariorum]KAI1471794.1 hypothetical protein F4812DRAFT_455899 [Daldinia caldariorum]
MPKTLGETSQPAIVDDIDAITPCPLTRGSHKSVEESGIMNSINKFPESRSPSPCSECSSVSADVSRSKRRESLKALEAGTEGDPERLWERMLVLQQTYGCYNSARMSAALSSGDVSLLLPSKACLNLLNENISFLPNGTGGALGEWELNTGSGHSH